MKATLSALPAFLTFLMNLTTSVICVLSQRRMHRFAKAASRARAWDMCGWLGRMTVRGERLSKLINLSANVRRIGRWHALWLLFSPTLRISLWCPYRQRQDIFVFVVTIMPSCLLKLLLPKRIGSLHRYFVGVTTNDR